MDKVFKVYTVYKNIHQNSYKMAISFHSDKNNNQQFLKKQSQTALATITK